MYTGRQQKEPTSRVIGQPVGKGVQQFRMMDNRESVYTLNCHSFARTQKSVLQRCILRNENNLYYSDIEPSHLFKDYIEASLYEAHLLKKRKPTLFTYTHTNGQHINKMGIPQGPHVMGYAAVNSAFEVAMREQDLQTILNEQCPPPDVWKEMVDQHGPFNNDLKPRIERAFDDYKTLYGNAEEAILSEDSNMAAFYIQRLMQLHPTTTYGWDTKAKAKQKEIKYKGENRDIFNDKNIDTTVVKRDSFEIESFIYDRRQLMDGDFKHQKVKLRHNRRYNFTPEEDNIILKWVKSHGTQKWYSLAEMQFPKTVTARMLRVRYVLDLSPFWRIPVPADL